MASYERKLTARQERRKRGDNGRDSAKAKNIVDTTLSQETKKQREYRASYDTAVTAGTAYQREKNGSWYQAIGST